MDSEEPIHIPNEDIGQENKPRTTKTPGDKHRKLPRADREGYAKSKGCVMVASSYAKSQQNKNGNLLQTTLKYKRRMSYDDIFG